MSERSDRRRVLARAGITVTATHGMRALTHRAVDREAGLPSGTASYHFPTRKELLRAVLTEIASVSVLRLTQDPHPDLAGVADPHRADAVRDQIAGACEAFILGQLTTYRSLTIARYALQAEVATDPDLREILHTADQFQALSEDACRELGVIEPATAGGYLLAFLDGIVHDHLVGAASLRPTQPADVAASAARAITAFINSLPTTASPPHDGHGALRM